MTKRFEMADLFCGAGGTSEGAVQALTAMGYAPRLGFPKGYLFTGNNTEVVKQIGNAVPCGLSRALAAAAVSQDAGAARKMARLS